MDKGPVETNVTATISEGADENKDNQLEDSYRRRKDSTKEIKAKYELLYREIVAKLSVAHLEPFEKILLDTEDCALGGKQEFIEAVQSHILSMLLKSFNDFWDEYKVTESLTSLEMLKEKYKSYEGTKWNILNKTPKERTLPARMYYKLAMERHLQKQLKFQNHIYEDVLQKNTTWRERIHDITQKRIYLKEKMELYTHLFKNAKSQLLQNDETNDNKLADT